MTKILFLISMIGLANATSLTMKSFTQSQLGKGEITSVLVDTFENKEKKILVTYFKTDTGFCSTSSFDVATALQIAKDIKNNLINTVFCSVENPTREQADYRLVKNVEFLYTK
jgi:hypothetical protein